MAVWVLLRGPGFLDSTGNAVSNGARPGQLAFNRLLAFAIDPALQAWIRNPVCDPAKPVGRKAQLAGKNIASLGASNGASAVQIARNLVAV